MLPVNKWSVFYYAPIRKVDFFISKEIQSMFFYFYRKALSLVFLITIFVRFHLIFTYFTHQMNRNMYLYTSEEPKYVLLHINWTEMFTFTHQMNRNPDSWMSKLTTKFSQNMFQGGGGVTIIYIIYIMAYFFLYTMTPASQGLWMV